MKIIRTDPWWSVHTHSRYSNCDAIPSVEQVVAEAQRRGQTALGLTDHGNMAGSIELYKACKKAGIMPFPGSELYFVPDTEQHRIERNRRDGIKASRYHLGVVAYDTVGYQNLVTLSTNTHKNFFHKPLVDFAMLAQMHDDGLLRGLAVTSGCYFGYAVQQLVTQGPESAADYLRTLDTYFPGATYVELQNHNIDHGDGWNDDKVADAMMEIADDLGLPCVLTQDSHYVNPEDKDAHDSLKQLVSFGADPDEAVFPGDGFHHGSSGWMRDHHGPDRLARGMEGLSHLRGRHDLGIPVLDSYSYNVPRVVPDPQGHMERRVREALKGKAAHLKQAEIEFDVIGFSDMAGYMLLVAEVCEWMRENGVVFQTRGSAAGSVVCWALGITNVDPIKWNLRFERFLAKDRLKPPDIDLDIAHDRRQELIDWLETRFTVHQIGTWMQFSMNDEDAEEAEGSLLQKYFSTANKTREKEEQIHQISQIPEDDRKMLYRLSDMNTYRGMGTNAAGVVLTSTPKEFDSLVPLCVRNAGGYVSQYHLKVIEDLGLVKLDVLGSKTLTVVRKTLEMLGKDADYLETIKPTDPKVYAEIAKGRTAGVFQLEGKSTTWGLKSLKPSKIEDLIAAMALFRPGVMNSKGDKHYIARKHGVEAMPVYHPLLMDVVASTYGILLYQEQVIDILRALGMESDDLTIFLKAVKASNKNTTAAAATIASYRPWIERRCREEGMDDFDLQYLESAFEAFADYSFNRAHAVVYGLTAYRCAWMALNHPLEFHAALLAVASEASDKKQNKEARYLVATRSRGVRVMAPKLNVSGATYTVDMEKQAIRKGLCSIKGIGMKTAECLAKHAPYASVEDLIERTPNKPITGASKGYNGDPASLTGVLGILRDTGLLEPLIYHGRTQ